MRPWARFENQKELLRGIIMKAFSVLMLVCLMAAPALAQEQQTLFSGDVTHGGYGAVIVKGTTFDGELGVLTGGGGAWLINNTIAIGGAGYGLVNDIETSRIDEDGDPMMLDVGYGGLYLAYIYNSDDLVHFTGGLLAGAGGVGYRRSNWEWSETGHSNNEPHDAFWVLEPEVMAELNVASWFRIGLGGSYRFAFGVDEDEIGYSNQDISGPSGTLMLKFGSF
jgi:hypothetical protein